MKTGSKITLTTIFLLVIAIGAALFYVITNLDSIVEPDKRLLFNQSVSPG